MTQVQWTEELSRRLKEMEKEDEEALTQLKHLRKKTDGYQVPQDAPSPLRYLLYDLQRLESEIKRHFKVENEILFTRVQVNPPPQSTSDGRSRNEASSSQA